MIVHCKKVIHPIFIHVHACSTTSQSNISDCALCVSCVSPYYICENMLLTWYRPSLHIECLSWFSKNMSYVKHEHILARNHKNCDEKKLTDDSFFKIRTQEKLTSAS
jgi:hypothetical protein